MKISNLIILLFITPLYFSCTGLFQTYADNIEVKEIESVKLEKIEILSRTIFLGINLKIINKNSIDVELSNGSYDVYINGNYFGKGSFNDKKEIKKNNDTTISLPVNSKVEDALLNLVQGGYKLNYKVSGTVKVKANNSSFNIPFEIEEGKLIIK